MSDPARDASRRTLEQVLRSVGDLARSMHGRVATHYKRDGSPVTEADLAMQEALVAALQSTFPGDGIVGEEGAREPAAEGHGTWWVDPIDGTAAFTRGFAHWGPTVSRVDGSGRLDVGAYYEPLLDRMFSAARGGGAWCDDVALDPARTDAVRTDDNLFVPSRIHQRPGLPWPGKLRVVGSTAAHLALLAAGGGRAAIVARWSTWDVGCGLLMNHEVGHVARLPNGHPFDLAVCTEGLPFLVGAPKALDILDTGGWASAALPARRT